VPWYWGKEQDKAFDGIKNAVTSAPVLAYQALVSILRKPNGFKGYFPADNSMM